MCPGNRGNYRTTYNIGDVAMIEITLCPRFKPKPFYFIVGAFVLIRLSLILFVDVTPTSDAAWYYEKGIAISQGHGYRRDAEFTAFWPVGYPAFLAGVFQLSHPSIIAGQLANLFLALLSCYFLIAIAFHVCGNSSVTMLTAAIFTFYPNGIAYSSILLSETLFTALLLLACWIYIRKSNLAHSVLAGIVFGFATLVKSQTMVVPAVLAIFDILTAKNSRARLHVLGKALALYVALAVILTPWALRNYAVFGEFVLVSTNGGISMLAGNNPGMTPDFSKDFVMDDALVESVGHPMKPELEVNRDAKNKAIGWIKDNPWEFLALIPHKVWRLWAPDGEAEWQFQAGSTSYSTHTSLFRSVRVLNQFYYASIVMLALLFPLLHVRKRISVSNRWIWLGYLLAIITTAISVAFSGQSRYHFPVMPFLMINAAWAAYYLRGRLVWRGPRITAGPDPGMRR